MEPAGSQTRRVSPCGAGNRVSSSTQVRKTQLPLCERGGLAPDDGAVLQGGGKTKHLIIPPAEMEPLRRATGRLRAAKARLEEQGNARLAEVIARISQLNRPAER